MIYIGAFLTEQSKKQLLTFIESKSPLLPNIFADHVTLVFKPYPEDKLKYTFGEKVKLKVIGYTLSDKAQVVVVDTDQLCKNSIPHITVSTNTGIKPFYSNQLLADGWEKCTPFLLDATIEYR
jgi:hypothetical protein